MLLACKPCEQHRKFAKRQLGSAYLGQLCPLGVCRNVEDGEALHGEDRQEHAAHTQEATISGKPWAMWASVAWCRAPVMRNVPRSARDTTRRMRLECRGQPADVNAARATHYVVITSCCVGMTCTTQQAGKAARSNKAHIAASSPSGRPDGC